ncbi:anti-adapter protein IraD [Escherichia coli]|uniref:anti-adapter protein IraD n=1 Tax=Escherichia coli TaxID=562 RepID=UPI001F10DC5A|nr:anti-adapter protein IraD [Escherichia coli]MCH4705409.1 anti-adapter protein IraD [Escherichia coli]
MMRQSLQAVLPEISGNKTSLLRKSVCSDILTLFNSPHSALPSLLVSGMPEWQVHNQSDKHLQSWYCRQLRSALLFHEPRIAALQVNIKEAYCHTLAISLEIMLYHDGEPLTFDLVWDNGGWCSAMLENVS